MALVSYKTSLSGVLYDVSLLYLDVHVDNIACHRCPTSVTSERLGGRKQDCSGELLSDW